jgi:hypothetical protein
MAIAPARLAGACIGQRTLGVVGVQRLQGRLAARDVVDHRAHDLHRRCLTPRVERTEFGRAQLMQLRHRASITVGPIALRAFL